MKRKHLIWVAVVATRALAGVACSSDSSTSSVAASAAAETSMSSRPDTSSMTITEVAASDPDFSTLVTAVKAAGLDKTLSGPGPYTVFAPTDEAFAALPSGTLDSLLQPKNKDELAAILTYHVVAGKVMASDVRPGKVTTVNGATFTVSTGMNGGVQLTDGQGNTANVTATDVQASNGVIHVIDAVLLPPSN